MAFTKTSTPIWYIDDTYANVAAQLKLENIKPADILFAHISATGGNSVVFVRRGGIV
jgi:hypothetical protein